ncbi:IS66 family insertion sequence element accessory protein TnpA [Paenibacillus periandrae]|uniref:IS66 family insertion sequence element accessory protein TnpA n=1 Tax=Paenibacillus periandrae TaxID=1761741 RepID=UPI001F092C0B|nr:hypothetical protein [Paenibacillus periandrae]
MTRKEQRHQEWSARVADYQDSGLTMKAWCDAQGVTKDHLRYWLRALKSHSLPAASQSPSFVSLRLTEPIIPSSDQSFVR